MKKILFLMAAVAMLTGLFAAESPSSQDEKEVRLVYLSMADKMAELDFTGAMALLAEDYVEVDAYGKKHTKEEIEKQTLSLSRTLPPILMLKAALEQNDLEKVLEAYMAFQGRQLPMEVRMKLKELPPEEKKRKMDDLKVKLAPLMKQFDAQFEQLRKWRESLKILSLEVSADQATVVATQQKMGNPQLLERSQTTLVNRNGKWFFLQTIILPVATTDIQ